MSFKNLSYRYTCTKCLYKIIHYSFYYDSKNFKLPLNEGVTVIEIMVVPHSGIFGSFLKMSGVVPYIVL